MQEDLQKVMEAYKAFEEAYKLVWHGPDRGYARWDSPQQKALSKAEKTFQNAVNESELGDMINAYADLEYRGI